MDLGPRDLFTKEICYNPEFQGYIVDKLKLHHITILQTYYNYLLLVD